MEYNYKPTFRFEPSGDLTLRPSEEALMVARANKEKNYTTVAKNPKKVLSNAKVIVLAQGGDVHDDRLVASENALQFGQYHGKSFRWILSNDVGYAVMILASHQQERRVVTDLSPEMVNKDQFNWYCNLFPEVQRAVEERRVLDGTMPPRPDLDHSHLVGFGDHKKLTYKELYEATDRERKSYMTWFRKIHVKQGTSMARFKVYVEHRDKTAASPNPGAEPSDQELLAVVMEMDNVPTGPEPTARPPTQSVSQPGGGPVQPAAGSSVILPEGWKLTLPREQQEWVSRAIFTTDKHLKCVLKKQLELWYFPPLPPNITHQPPASPNSYFLRPFCLWMPYRLWAFRFVCTQSQCNGRKLTGCGVYKTVRKVLDLDGWYFMGTEYLECSKCKKKWASWSLDVLNQLDPSHRAKFPAILTYRLSCDMKVVRLMRERTLGNSVTRLYSLLREQHSADWMARTLDYLTVCKHYVVPGVAPVKITTPPHIPVPSAQWLLTVHGYDVLFQVEDFKARITSIFGSILKMDSTKKVTKKLAGAAHGTAAWATNVGNEYGQVLITVLTDSEGEGLLNMTTGLQNRYSQAGVAAPKLLYVDRDCCTLMGKGRAAAMFSQWEDLYVRLDIWHFIRRFAGGVTSESHPLYSLFLQRLSSCIFVWCAEDAERLREAKRGELAARRIGGLCDSEINKRITSKEMALHCRRQTRGAEDTERLIGELLECLMNATDTMGIPLLDRDRMKVIWQTQRRHVTCIQDPPGVSLYVKTKSLTKGGVVLPVLRCARGSTSLESFHLHLNRFIPGTSASAEHFQAYLLEGLTRWNEDRAEAAALGDRQQSLHSYDGVAQYAINKLSQELMGCSLVTDYTKPAKYTGELIGVEYLYSQTGGHHQVLDYNLGMDPDVPDGIPEEMETEQSEGVQVEDDEEVDPTILWHSLDENLPPLLPVRSASPSPPAVCLDQEEDEYMGPDRVGGYQHVVLLAKCLVRLLEGPWISNRQANEIVALWERLRDVDKMAVVYPERFRDRVLQGVSEIRKQL
ncbi:hypothetical protein DPEC_G00099780 [Dallia pectoralis]|uniref:Uncharacterized protein n=1 Tax=Dallia pectoralis TaxID=75939 RepID=A0ACC2GW82_DALPE|nr:hypothetical protein DPEC_G00099780 [Dallia pectoralis]